MKTILFTLITGLISLSAMATEPAIRGRVLDKGKAPIPFVNVLVMNPADSSLVKGAVTDTSGTFTVDNLPQGRYLLAITSVGYDKKVVEVDLSPAVQASQLDIVLEENASNLKEVIVKGRKPLIEVRPDRLVLNVENSIVAAGNNALEVLSRAPGIVVTPQDQINLRGKSGVLVLIDDRPTNLSMTDVVNMLKSMQSSEIEKIEVINNPPAKYDAAGTSGIINIKTIKGKNYGTSGTATANATQGHFFRATTGVNLQHTQQKYTLNGNLNLSTSKLLANWEGQNLYKTGGRITQILNSSRPEIYTRKSLNARLGGDYYLSEKTTIGAMSRLIVSTNGLLDNTLTNILSDQNVLLSGIRKNSDQQGHTVNLTSNMNLKHVFKPGHELTADADYTYFSDKTMTDISNNFFDADGQTNRAPLLLQNRPTTDIQIGIAKADYNRPLSDRLTLEAGVKTSIVRANNDARFYENQQNVWTTDVSRTNTFLYNEHIAAGYASVGGRVKTMDVKLGLRGEYTDYTGESAMTQSSVSNRYFQLFPSVFLSKPLNDKNVFSFSYSRRIDRPNYQSLNPFVYVSDIYTQTKGNPFLKPQFTNSFEVNYTLADRYVTTLSYQQTKGTITQVLQRDAANPNVVVWTETNLDNSYFYGVTFMAPVTLAPWWTLENTLLLNYNDIKTTLSDGRFYRLNRPSLAYNFTNSFKLPGGFTGELTGYYNSFSVSGTYRIWPQYQVNFGLKKISSDKLTTYSLTANDFLRTYRLKAETELADIAQRINYRYDTRTVRFTISRKFGNTSMKAAKQRSSASETEQDRIKTN